MKPKRAKEAGFTMIEMLITVAIIGVLTAVAIPSFGGLMQRYRLQGAANEISMDLLLTRMRAIKLGTPQAVSFNAANGSWTVPLQGQKTFTGRGYSRVSYLDNNNANSILLNGTTVTFNSLGVVTEDFSGLGDVGKIYLKNERGDRMMIEIEQYSGQVRTR